MFLVKIISYVQRHRQHLTKFLDSKNLLHKDLTVTNCLIDHSYTINMTDITMCNDRFKQDYNNIGDRLLPPSR